MNEGQVMEVVPVPDPGPQRWARFKVWLRNLPNLPNCLMARWLRGRGWVAFYLDERSRNCNGGTCWLSLYQDGERQDRN